MKILLIAGHGGSSGGVSGGGGDPGACAFGLKEANLTRDLVSKIYNNLKHSVVVHVYDTSKNLYSELKSGRESKNIFKLYDYVLECHFNACVQDLEGNGYTTGSECFVKGEKGITVEQGILAGLSSLGFKNRGVKERTNLQNLNMCRSVGTSYCLLETCFIDDKDDIDLYLKNKDAVAKVVSDAILKGFGIKEVESTVVPTELVTVNDIVWELANRGIISNSELWLKKLEEDINSYWLARKAVKYIRDNDK